MQLIKNHKNMFIIKHNKIKIMVIKEAFQ